MRYRVIQWATGNVGKHAVRGIVEHPQTELVGALVYSAEKAGRDVGEICGIGRLGVAATDDVAAVLAQPADCVVYAPLLPNLDEVCQLLESGKNVVTPVGWIYPPSIGSEVVARLEAACRAGGVSLHGTGINPGGISDRFALMVSALARNITAARIDEFSDIRNYNAPMVISEVMLMGKPLKDVQGSPMLDLLGGGFRQSIDMVAAAMHVQLDGYDTKHEIALATAPIEMRYGTIAKGTVAGQRFTWSGTHRGRPLITTRVTWVMGHEHLDADWPFDGEGWIIAIDGDPPVRCRITTAWDPAAAVGIDPAYRKDHGIIATAMHLVNAIPSVCDAPPGIQTYLQLPMIAGRFRT
ncbi:MAG TPA: dihydrodipicolinate reductase [Candidatus Binatia bacterium]|nr:dihydrodipicolinate reductase [Candidatus Binatia bacterium]